MIRRTLVSLILLCAVGNAMSPAHRHRVRMTEPDPAMTQAHTQIQIAEMVAVALTERISVPQFDSFHIATQVQELMEVAKRLIGSRYRRGSTGPHTFDCSGFTSYVFQHLGVTLKRSSQEQFNDGKVVDDVRQLLPGDLIFFGNNGKKGKRVHHVGIVTEVNADEGTFNFIHSCTSQGVRISSSTDDYWTRKIVGARRMINNE